MKRITPDTSLGLAFLSLYSPLYPFVLIDALEAGGYGGWRFVKWYWQAKSYFLPTSANWGRRSVISLLLLVLLIAGILAQVLLGLTLVYFWARYKVVGGWEFGLALIVSYPIVWALILAVAMVAGDLMNVKRVGRNLICMILEHQVRVLRRRHQFTVVAVAGSVGKTSTKLAVAKLLEAEKRVIYQEGNYNDRVTVPLVLFGQDKPASLFDARAWLRIFAANQRIIQQGFQYDIAVLELGTDGPGQVAEFAYLQPDIAVVASVAPEHMEYFGTLDAVAKEELSVGAFSKRLLINADDIDGKYQSGLPHHLTYGLGKACDYRAEFKVSHALDGSDLTLNSPNGAKHTAHTSYMGAHGVKVVLSAFAVADMLGLPIERLIHDLERLEPFSGRMKLLDGKHGAKIIDDTYNASPLAVKAALDVLYSVKDVKRIAILGSMNELGETSAPAHEEIGEYCDPKKLAAVVTIGRDANAYLAPTATKRGCTVMTFTSPYDAGKWVEEQLSEDTIVLAKGSQNGVFAEEAVKALLAHREDEKHLVRQSSVWMRIKRKQFTA